MKTPILGLILIVLSSAMSVALSDSLYSSAPVQANPSANTDNAAPVVSHAISYFSDSKARQVGDILTVIITETASGTSTATTTKSKSDSASFGPGTGSILRLIRNFGLSESTTGNGTGTTNRSDNLTATIAVTVKQVLPSGNLVVEGARTVGTNAEAQTITLTGTIRPQDISPTNTIQSPQVADAQIRYSGKGPVGEIQHDSIVQKIFRWLF